jgi:outer membrane protein assembly factor BamE (lipoprotein component of BamABCDE complex)
MKRNGFRIIWSIRLNTPHWIARFTPMSNQDYGPTQNDASSQVAGRGTLGKAGRPLFRTFAAVAVIALGACAADITKHGHIMNDEDLAQVKEGMSRDQVVLALGTPDTKSTVGQEAFYYISSTTKRSAAFLSPTLVDRRVVAVYFDKKDNVQRVAHYGLQDGKVIDFVKRETPSKGSEDGLLKELFRNIGRPTGGVNAGGY